MPVEIGQSNWSTLDNRSALVAVLPTFLFGLLVSAITVFLLIIGGPSQITNLAEAVHWHNVALVVGAVALTILVYAGIVAFRGHLSVWSYTWIGAGFTGLLIVMFLVAEDRAFVITPTMDIIVLAISFISGLIVYLTAAVRGWEHTGLLSIGFCATLGLSLCFLGVAGPFQIQLGLIAFIMGLILSLLVYFYTRLSNKTRIAVLVSVGVANAGIAWMVEDGFRSSNPSRGMDQYWNLLFIITVLLVVGTLGGHIGPRLRQIFMRLFKR